MNKSWVFQIVRVGAAWTAMTAILVGCEKSQEPPTGDKSIQSTIPKLFSKNRQTMNDAYDSLVAQGERSVQPLIDAAIKESDANNVYTIGTVLHALPPAPVVGQLRGLLSGGDRRRLKTALELLSFLDKKVVQTSFEEELLRGYADEDPAVRFAALKIRIDVSHEPFLSAFRKALKDESDICRLVAAWSLIASGVKDGYAGIEEFISTKDAQTAVNIMSALQETPTADGLRMLRKMKSVCPKEFLPRLEFAIKDVEGKVKSR